MTGGNIQGRQITVRGRVQGVWFRATAREEARRLGLTGFVMNRADGSVYIEAAGKEADLEAFIAWCRSGPPLADVKEVEVHPCEPGHFDDFEIKR